jgi:hypothetical protein
MRSPRRLAAPLAVGCALALGSCVAVTDPATDVGTWQARLHGHGHTDSTPATFYFEYATQRADLGTANARRTPTRTAPANVRNDVAFSNRVTDLEPATTYFYRVCGRDGGSTSDVCDGVQSFATQAGVPGLKVSVGYAKSYGNETQPYPEGWAESRGTRGSVTFVGDLEYVPGFDIHIWDTGALRFDNTTAAPVTLDKVAVTIGTKRYNVDDDLWQPAELVVPANGTLILAQTGGNDFDTSEAAGENINCGSGPPAPVTPEVVVTYGGVQTTFHDTTRPLTPSWRGGVLNYECGSETHPWQRVDVVR